MVYPTEIKIRMTMSIRKTTSVLFVGAATNASVVLVDVEAFAPMGMGAVRHRQHQQQNQQRPQQRRQRLNYFDDCERLSFLEEYGGLGSSLSFVAGVSPFTNMTYSQEKLLALDMLLGYNPQSASLMTDTAIEEETLRWAVDTNVVWSPDDDDDDDDDDDENNDDSGVRNADPSSAAVFVTPTSVSSHSVSSSSVNGGSFSAKYEKIQDLLVASECETTLDSIVVFWRVLADALSPSSSLAPSSSSGGATLVVFPQARSLWDYDQSVLLLQAIEICKPWFVPPGKTITFDLFHPQYKHSPRMWSQETHSPFPTVGIVINDPGHYQRLQEDGGEGKSRSSSSSHFKEILDNPVIDMKATKAKLNALFQSVDATPASDRLPRNKNKSRQEILLETQDWFIHCQSREKAKISLEQWRVEDKSDPVQLYKTLWESIQSLVSSPSSSLTSSRRSIEDGPSSTSPPRQSEGSVVVVAPLFDAHVLHRVAVTVNAALKRLCIPVRVSKVHHPNQHWKTREYSILSSSLPTSMKDKDWKSELTKNAPYGLIELSLES